MTARFVGCRVEDYLWLQLRLKTRSRNRVWSGSRQTLLKDIYVWMDAQMRGWMKEGRRGWIDGWWPVRTSLQAFEACGPVLQGAFPMDRRMDRRMDEWTDGRMDGWMDGRAGWIDLLS